jgi:hypothetical protein
MKTSFNPPDYVSALSSFPVVLPPTFTISVVSVIIVELKLNLVLLAFFFLNHWHFLY